MPASFDAIVSSKSPDTSGPESVRKDTRLLLVSNDAMRARRRPVAVLALYIYQLVVSLVVAYPVSRALANVFGGHPRGDAVLFDDGGWALLALRSAWDRASPAFFGLLFIVTIVSAVVGLVPLSALLTSISHATPDMRAPRLRHLAPYAAVTFAPLVYLLAIGSALELSLLAVAAFAFGATREALEPKYGDARADQIAALACFAVLFFTAIAAVLHDLARAALVRHRAGTFAAIRAALGTLRRVAFRVLWSWTWRAFVSLALVVCVAALVPRFGARGFIMVALLHQLVAIARVSLRASWLARALRAVDAHANVRKR
jgi:hypothetical protein